MPDLVWSDQHGCHLHHGYSWYGLLLGLVELPPDMMCISEFSRKYWQQAPVYSDKGVFQSNLYSVNSKAQTSPKWANLWPIVFLDWSDFIVCDCNCAGWWLYINVRNFTLDLHDQILSHCILARTFNWLNYQVRDFRMQYRLKFLACCMLDIAEPFSIY